MAKAQGSEAFAFAGDRAVQFHGGFGLLTNAMPSCSYGVHCGASTSLVTRHTTGICWRRCCLMINVNPGREGLIGEAKCQVQK